MASINMRTAAVECTDVVVHSLCSIVDSQPGLSSSFETPAVFEVWKTDRLVCHWTVRMYLPSRDHEAPWCLSERIPELMS